MTFTEAEQVHGDLGIAVYRVAVEFYESKGEHGGILYGNGHHMAQYLVTEAHRIFWEHAVSQVLEEEWARKRAVNAPDREMDAIASQRARYGLPVLSGQTPAPSDVGQPDKEV